MEGVDSADLEIFWRPKYISMQNYLNWELVSGLSTGTIPFLWSYGVYVCGGLIAMLTLAQGFTFTSDVFLLNAWTSEENTWLPLMNGFLE